MHGRIKVRTTEEQKLIKKAEEKKKLAIYQAGVAKVFNNRPRDSYDEEIFNLTATLLASNPDIYTMWNIRKEMLLYLQKNRTIDQFCGILDKEVKLTEHCLLSNPKSYSSWYHRYWVLKIHPRADWGKELKLCMYYLTIDDRNFHCWDYRRLLIAEVGVPIDDELKFSTDCLRMNFSNYSAWHYRSTVLKVDPENNSSEFQLIQDATFTDPTDTSAWFYLNWVVNNISATEETLRSQLEAIEQLIELEPDSKWAIMMRWTLLMVINKGEGHEEECLNCIDKLIALDPMRKGRYNDLKNKIMAKN